MNVILSFSSFVCLVYDVSIFEFKAQQSCSPVCPYIQASPPLVQCTVLELMDACPLLETRCGSDRGRNVESVVELGPAWRSGSGTALHVSHSRRPAARVHDVKDIQMSPSSSSQSTCGRTPDRPFTCLTTTMQNTLLSGK